MQEILDRTGYSLEITSGQRKYGGPPPNYDGPTPAPGQEVSFCVFALSKVTDFLKFLSPCKVCEKIFWSWRPVGLKVIEFQFVLNLSLIHI